MRLDRPLAEFILSASEGLRVTIVYRHTAIPPYRPSARPPVRLTALPGTPI
jgi:hypothetical protein